MISGEIVVFLEIGLQPEKCRDSPEHERMGFFCQKVRYGMYGLVSDDWLSSGSYT